MRRGDRSHALVALSCECRGLSDALARHCLAHRDAPAGYAGWPDGSGRGCSVSGDAYREIRSIRQHPLPTCPAHRLRPRAFVGPRTSGPQAAFLSPCLRRGRSNTHGFTLIEVLLATVLLAAGLALAFATLRAATATSQRGEALARHSERIRAVEGFLRRRIASALPVGFAVDEATGTPVRFIGEPDRMRFVADLPDYLGRGGPHLHDISVVGNGDGARLVVALSMVLAGQIVEDRDRRLPEPLVPDLKEARFRYRGLDDQNKLGEWSDQWETSDRLPLQVRIDIQSADTAPWPALVIALPQAASFNAGAGQFR